MNNLSAVAPFRLDRSQALTCDNDNKYKDEQTAYNSGQINLFATTTSGTTSPPAPLTSCLADLSMGYYDGNTVTALWNYAQYFAMSDNYFDTEFGVTEEGHQNLVAGQTHTTSGNVSGKVVNGSIIANVEAGVDDCVSVALGNTPVLMTSKNIGDLHECGRNQPGAGSTAIFRNPAAQRPSPAHNARRPPAAMPITATMRRSCTTHRLRISIIFPPASTAAIGTSGDQANHNYSLVDFTNALAANNLPAVTFLKAPTTETGHPANSTPLTEQTFLVDTINSLMQSQFWPQMAIFITYDDSDGWYDHVMPPIVNQSNDSANDTLAGSSLHCGSGAPLGGYLDRCGYGTRLPLLAISPYAKQNYVDHALTDTTSVLRFIEDNWSLGRVGKRIVRCARGYAEWPFRLHRYAEPTGAAVDSQR